MPAGLSQHEPGGAGPGARPSAATEAALTSRNPLPQRRLSETFELRHGGKNILFAVTLSRYPDGKIGEVFISGAKAGSEIEAVARDGAVLLSIALQYNVPLKTIKHAITREQDGTPSTIVGAVIDKLAHNEPD